MSKYILSFFIGCAFCLFLFVIGLGQFMYDNINAFRDDTTGPIIAVLLIIASGLLAAYLDVYSRISSKKNDWFPSPFLTSCPHCEGQISSNASYCPKCQKSDPFGVEPKVACSVCNHKILKSQAYGHSTFIRDGNTSSSRFANRCPECGESSPLWKKA